MKAYKGFNKDMTCRDFQYEVGKEYGADNAKVCESGFHACENPLDCFNYYAPSQSVYHEVEVDGDLDKSGDDTKVAATKIKIGARLDIAGIVKAAIDFVMSMVKSTSGDWAHSATSGDRANSATSGDRANSATSGDGAHSATSGYRANSATSGDRAHSATSGDRANSATSGDWANSEVKGEDSIAAVLGKDCKARGGLGCWLVLTERDNEWHILGVKAIRINGKKYQADTWYELKGGRVVRTEP